MISLDLTLKGKKQDFVDSIMTFVVEKYRDIEDTSRTPAKPAQKDTPTSPDDIAKNVGPTRLVFDDEEEEEDKLVIIEKEAPKAKTTKKVTITADKENESNGQSDGALRNREHTPPRSKITFEERKAALSPLSLIASFPEKA